MSAKFSSGERAVLELVVGDVEGEEATRFCYALLRGIGDDVIRQLVEVAEVVEVVHPPASLVLGVTPRSLGSGDLADNPAGGPGSLPEPSVRCPE